MPEKEKKDGFFQGWKNYVSIGLTAFLVLAAAISFYFIILRLPAIAVFLNRVLAILQPVLIGLAIAYLVHPIVEFFERNFRKWFKKECINGEVHAPSRFLAVAVTLILLIAFLYILGSMVLPELITTISGIIRVLPAQTNRLIREVQRLLENHTEISEQVGDVFSGVSDYAKKWMETDLLPTMTNIALGLKDVLVILLNIIIGLIISIYVLTTREKFTGQAKKLLYVVVKNRKKANFILSTVRMSDRVFSGFVSGTLIKSLILGVVCFILMTLLRLPYAMLVSVIVGVTNIVPFFGPYVGAAIGAILIVLESPIQALYFLILILILQQIDGNIMGPKILGDSTGPSSFWVITAILLGGGLFGVLGMILGVPVFAVCYHIVRNVVDEKLKEKELPTDSLEFAFVDAVEEDGTIHKLSADVFISERDERTSEKANGKKMQLLRTKNKMDSKERTDNKEQTIRKQADADSGEKQPDEEKDTNDVL